MHPARSNFFTMTPIDRNVAAVQAKMQQRAELGLKKYGVTTERTDLTLLDWLRHAQEEAMDQAIYLEAAIQAEMKRQNGTPLREAFAVLAACFRKDHLAEIERRMAKGEITSVRPKPTEHAEIPD